MFTPSKRALEIAYKNLQPRTGLPDDAINKIREIRGNFVNAYAVLLDLLPSGEDKNMALMSVKAASMWAVKAVTDVYPAKYPPLAGEDVSDVSGR